MSRSQLGELFLGRGRARCPAVVRASFGGAQLAVAGEVDPQEAASQLGRGIAQLQNALRGIQGSEALGVAVEQLRRCNFYAVLRALRRVLPIETMLLARAHCRDGAEPAASESQETG